MDTRRFTKGFTPLEKLDSGVELHKAFNLLRGKDENYFLTGFTLMELLVVITIISLLAGIGGLVYTSARIRGRDSQRQADLKKIQNALEVYYSDEHFYPGTYRPGDPAAWQDVSVVQALGSLTPDYLKELPSDPEGDTYMYSSNGTCYCLSAKLEKPDGSAAPTGCAHYSGYNYTVRCP